MHILLSLASLFKWRLSKIDVKTAFLQTGQATRDVYVITPCERNDRGRSLRLLLAAAYGLINGNEKWQELSEKMLFRIGFIQVPLVPQLLYIKLGASTVAIIAKIVDDILISDSPADTDPIIEKINIKFKLGTIVHGPG